MVIGNAQMQMKQFATSWETLRTALDLAIQSGEDRVRGKALVNLGAVALMLKRPEALTYLKQARDWYSNHGDVYTEIERETILQDSLMLMSRAAEQAGNEQDAERYKQEFLQSMSADPERYNQVRESPCYALYKARPANQTATR
jgi:tetratricopeptide (TPR) repeat protein